MVYDAFLSYSGKADELTARQLQRALHRYSKPWYRLRALRVFRDRLSLDMNETLWTSIQRALGESRYLVLLASPDSAQSEWVGRETTHWIDEKGGASKVLCVVTGGEVVRDGGSEDFSRLAADCLPPSLLGAFDEEPLFVDLRSCKSRGSLTLEDPEFRDVVATLAATLHGKPKDEIIGEDVRQQRRTRSLVRATITTVVLLLSLAAGSVFVALAQRKERLVQEELAETRYQGARKTKYALGLRALGDRDSGHSTLFGITTDSYEYFPWDLREFTWGYFANRRLVGDDSIEQFEGGDEHPRDAAFSFDGRLFTIRGSRRVTIWDGSRTTSWEPPGSQGSLVSVSCSLDGRYIAVGRESSSLLVDDSSTAVWRVDEEPYEHVGEWPGSRAEFNRDGSRLVIGRHDDVRLLEVPGFSTVGTTKTRGEALSFSFSRTGLLAIGCWDDSIRIWDCNDWAEVGRLEGHKTSVVGVAFSAAGDRLYSIGEDDPFDTDRSRLIAWDVSRRERVGDEPLKPQGTGIALSPDGKTLAVRHLGRVSFWMPDGLVLVGFGDARGDSTRCIEFSPDGTLLATGSELHRAADRKTGFDLPSYSTGVFDLAFDEDSSSLLVVGGWAQGLEDSQKARWGFADRWDLESFERRRVFTDHDNAVYSMAFVDDGGLAILRTRRDLRSLATDDWLETWKTDDSLRTEHRPQVLAASPRGRSVVVAQKSGLEVRSVDASSETLPLDGSAPVTMSDDGRWFASGGDPSSVLIRRVAGGGEAEVIELPDDRARSLCFGPDDRLWIGTEGGSIVCWSRAQGRIVATLSPEGGPINSIDITADGRWIATGSGEPDKPSTSGVPRETGRVDLWDTRDLEAPIPVMSIEGAAQAVTISRDERFLATATYSWVNGSGVSQTRVWDFERLRSR